MNLAAIADSLLDHGKILYTMCGKEAPRLFGTQFEEVSKSRVDDAGRELKNVSIVKEEKRKRHHQR